MRSEDLAGMITNDMQPLYPTGTLEAPSINLKNRCLIFLVVN